MVRGRDTSHIKGVEGRSFGRKIKKGEGRNRGQGEYKKGENLKTR